MVYVAGPVPLIRNNTHARSWANPNASDMEKLRLCIEGGDMKTVANHYFPIRQAADAFALVRSGNSVVSNTNCVLSF